MAMEQRVSSSRAKKDRPSPLRVQKTARANDLTASNLNSFPKAIARECSSLLAACYGVVVHGIERLGLSIVGCPSHIFVTVGHGTVCHRMAGSDTRWYVVARRGTR